LAAFQRVAIAKGATTTVTLELPVELLKVYSEQSNEFVVIPGKVSVEVGASSADIRLTGSITLAGPTAEGR
jgi:beta-glucosidase